MFFLEGVVKGEKERVINRQTPLLKIFYLLLLSTSRKPKTAL